MKKPIYLDYHATTPCDPRVLETMLPYFTETFGNPSSRGHAFGRAAEDAVEDARECVASLIGAEPVEVVFTSTATEANNLAIHGAARARRAAGDGDHVVTVLTEHKSVIEPYGCLEKEGFRVTRLGVREDGLIDLDEARDAITEGTVLVSVAHANNEIGTIQPIAEIAAIARSVGAWVLTDAVQAVGKLPVDVDEMDVDMLSMSAHKFYGPKGVGALYVRQRPRKIKIDPCLFGGGQERGLRSGTHNVPGIVGLAAALRIADEEREVEGARLGVLRDRLLDGLRAGIDDLIVNGTMTERLPNNLNVSVPFVDGEALLLSIDDIAISSGSACRTSTLGASHVMKAIGRDDDLSRSTIRFGLGRWTTEEEIDYAIERIPGVVGRLRAMTALP